jgi:hypothetical protein
MVDSVGGGPYLMALEDPTFGNHLRERASQLQHVSALNDWHNPGTPRPPDTPCEISYTDSFGNEMISCGTADDCNNFFIILLIFLLIGLLEKLWDWL